MKQDGQTKRKKKTKGGAEKQRKKRLKSSEAEAAKCFKITNYSFGAVTGQSSEPEGTGSGEQRERPSEPSDTSSTVTILQLKREDRRR